MPLLVRLSACLLYLMCITGSPIVAAAANCKVVDLMPAYWQALQSTDASQQLRATVIDPHPDLYNPNYVDLPTGKKWEDKLARERAYAESHRAEVIAAENYLSQHVPQYMAGFAKTFPDYRCDFTFYIAPSFGGMDGSAASVAGQHRIIFAPDVIPRYHQLTQLKVLIDHETFHIYHHQATNAFGASEETLPTIFNALWTEGLATFVSWRMNPEVSLDIALLQPGIPQGAAPRLADIAGTLLANLDTRDKTVFAQYFMANRQPEGYPPRSGYYVGMLVAQRLSERYTLQQLARLNGPVLHQAIVAELEKLQQGK